MVFDEVQTDLEAEGYEVQPVILPACAVNAPHRRDRVWFVAFNASGGYGRNCLAGTGEGVRMDLEGNELLQTGRNKSTNKSEATDNNASDTNNQRCEQGCDNRQERYIQDNIGITAEDKPERAQQQRRVGKVGDIRIPANADSQQRPERGMYEVEPAPAKRYTGSFDSRNGGDYWQSFPTQSPVCVGDDGFSTELVRQRIREDSMGHLSEKEIDQILSKAATKWREATIMAAGNAVVPQVVLQIFKAIDEFERRNAA